MLILIFKRCLAPNFQTTYSDYSGIEFASELRDFITSDISKYYGNVLKHARIKIIEASPTVLAPFDPSLQAAAIEALNRRTFIQDQEVADMLPPQFKLTELLLENGVKEVKEDVICLKNGREIPYGVAVWAAGNGPLPIALNVIAALGEGEQVSICS